MVISFSVILLLSLIPSRALQQNPPWIEFNATGKPFLWGIATAPAHVEDALDDSWWDWAQQGRIPFVLSEGVPFRRLQFWSQPELELDLAQQTGVQIFRFGIDWGRLVPFPPHSFACDQEGYVRQRLDGRKSNDSDESEKVPPLKLDEYSEETTSFSTLSSEDPIRHRCRMGIQDREALEHYVKIIQSVRRRGMAVMLTLFHHSLPKWANEKAIGGWTNPQTVDYFVAFARDLVTAVASLVDYYVVLNEAAIFANLVYGVGMWPGRLRESPDYTWAYLDSPLYRGAVMKAYQHMAEAHRLVFALIKEQDTVVADPQLQHAFQGQPAVVGIAHNVAHYVPMDVAANPLVHFLEKMVNFNFLDRIVDHLDFIGVNYYGKELVSTMGRGAVIHPREEYSESGRAISPNGLYHVLLQLNERYARQRQNNKLYFFMTENGISDETDVLRPSYLIEHLAALKQVMDQGVNVLGYIHWTISDNWEWADGYCPKFGLFSVDRHSANLTRTSRPSFSLFQHIVTKNSVTWEQRLTAWNNVKSHVGQLRPFCRAKDGKGTVNERTYRPFVNTDWRFSLINSFNHHL